MEKFTQRKSSYQNKAIMRSTILSILFLFTISGLKSQDCLPNIPISDDGVICVNSNARIKCDELQDITIRVGTDANLYFTKPVILKNNVKIIGESVQLSRVFARGLITIEGTGVEIEGVTIEPAPTLQAAPCHADMNVTLQKTCKRPGREAIKINSQAAAKITNVNIKFFKSGITAFGEQNGTVLEGLMFERVGDMLDRHCNGEGFGFEINDVAQNCACGDLVTTDPDNNNTNPSAICGANMSRDYGAVVLTNVSDFKMYSSFHHVSKHATTILINGTLTGSEFVAVSCEQFGYCAKSIDFGPGTNENDILFSSDEDDANFFRIVENIGCPQRIGY